MTNQDDDLQTTIARAPCPEVYRDLHYYEKCTFEAGHTGPHSFTEQQSTVARAEDKALAWALRGRDGEPVTLIQKLEQSMEFGSAMERLAIENNARATEAEAKDKLHEESMMHHYHLWLKTDDKLREAEAALANLREELEEARAAGYREADFADRMEKELAEAKSRLATVEGALDEIANWPVSRGSHLFGERLRKIARDALAAIKQLEGE